MINEWLNVEQDDLVTGQYTGGATDAVESRQFQSAREAMDFYAMVCERLNDVNRWGQISKVSLSAFRLFSKDGMLVSGKVQQGDYIRIDIPGPGLEIGQGYDWVQVEKVSHNVIPDGNLFTIKVRPSINPLSKNGRTAHFLSPCATSTFQVRRSGLTVTAEEHARNEKANLQTGSFLGNLRNFLVGTAARFGLSYPQWKSLVKGLVRN